jgi:hypothetical protein
MRESKNDPKGYHVMNERADSHRTLPEAQEMSSISKSELVALISRLADRVIASISDDPDLGSVSKPVILPIGLRNNTEVVAHATARING